MAEFDYKKALLEAGEESVKHLIKSVLRPFAEEYIKKSENKYDDLFLGFLDEIEKALLDAAEQINKDDN